MELKEKESELIESLQMIPDAYERLAYLVEFGKNAPKLESSLKLDSFKIEGCLSQLWIVPEFKGNKCYFKSESDSAIVQGIASLLCDFYSDQPPSEILTNDASFLGEVGINQHLSPNRRNGLSKIVQSVHHFAESCIKD